MRRRTVMAEGGGKLVLRAISAIVVVALVFVGLSILYDVVRALVSAGAFLLVGYVAWRVVKALNR